MTNKIEGYIGCQACGTALFRIESKKAARAGVFENEVKQLGDAAPGAKHCPTEGCGAVLTRVPAPE